MAYGNCGWVVHVVYVLSLLAARYRTDPPTRNVLFPRCAVAPPLFFVYPHFHLPHRHCRKLLFPPGLLALSGLLWLGCVALGSHPEQLRRRTVLQLTMPPRSGSDVIWPPPVWDGLKHEEPQLRYSGLAHLRNWSTVEFGHGRTVDSAAARRTERTLRTLAIGSRDRPTNSGLRIYFGPRAHYASLVLVLDLMEQYNVKKHFFDTRHYRTGTAFYAFSGSIRPQRWHDRLRTPAPKPSLADDVVPHLPPPSSPLWNRLTTAANWWPPALQVAESWQSLAAPDWRGPLALLACLAALSVWRGRL